MLLLLSLRGGGLGFGDFEVEEFLRDFEELGVEDGFLVGDAGALHHFGERFETHDDLVVVLRGDVLVVGVEEFDDGGDHIVVVARTTLVVEVVLHLEVVAETEQTQEVQHLLEEAVVVVELCEDVVAVVLLLLG